MASGLSSCGYRPPGMTRSARAYTYVLGALGLPVSGLPLTLAGLGPMPRFLVRGRGSFGLPGLQHLPVSGSQDLRTLAKLEMDCCLFYISTDVRSVEQTNLQNFQFVHPSNDATTREPGRISYISCVLAMQAMRFFNYTTVKTLTGEATRDPKNMPSTCF